MGGVGDEAAGEGAFFESVKTSLPGLGESDELGTKCPIQRGCCFGRDFAYCCCSVLCEDAAVRVAAVTCFSLGQRFCRTAERVFSTAAP